MRTEINTIEMIQVPDFERYLICKEGFVYDTKRQKFVDGYINWSSSSKAYRKLAIADNSGKHTLLNVHKLLAIVFIHNPNNYKCIDHLDSDSLNNSLINLRWCTSATNNQNRTPRKNTTSQFMGVCFHKATQKWISKIYINGKTKYLGLFTNEVEAAKAYNTAAIEAGYLHWNKNI